HPAREASHPAIARGGPHVVESQRRREPSGDVASSPSRGRLLQADQVDVEAAQTLDDHGQPLVEVLAVTAKTEAAVEVVEADEAERPWRVYVGYGPGEGEEQAATSENPIALHRPAFPGSGPELRGRLVQPS